jgi:ubiquinone/menaquinone biosynthesis C-methylase UbiE
MITTKISDPGAVRDMYNAEAESYSTMMDTEIKHPLYSDTLERLQTRIKNLPGMIIDAPCGSGQMLAMYHENFDQDRAMLGIDLSPKMVEITSKRLGSAAEVIVGDIRELDSVPSESAAAVISHFAIHHLDVDGVLQALVEWHRVLRVGGQLVIGAWEGTGGLDYGDSSDIVAIKHDASELERMIREWGFSISRSVIELDEEMMMNAVYIECSRD